MQGAGWAHTGPSLAPSPSPALGRGRAAPHPRSHPQCHVGSAAPLFHWVVDIYIYIIFFFCFFFCCFLKKKKKKKILFCFVVIETFPTPGASIRPWVRREDGAALERAATERNELWQRRDVWICLVFGFPLEQRWVWSVLG